MTRSGVVLFACACVVVLPEVWTFVRGHSSVTGFPRYCVLSFWLLFPGLGAWPSPTLGRSDSQKVSVSDPSVHPLGTRLVSPFSASPFAQCVLSLFTVVFLAFSPAFHSLTSRRMLPPYCRCSLCRTPLHRPPSFQSFVSLSLRASSLVRLTEGRIRSSAPFRLVPFGAPHLGRWSRVAVSFPFLVPMDSLSLPTSAVPIFTFFLFGSTVDKRYLVRSPVNPCVKRVGWASSLGV